MNRSGGSGGKERRFDMRVRVNGWLTPRSIQEEDGKVLFEVAEDDGCATCQRRIEHVRQALAGKGITANFRTMPSAYSAHCLYVVLDSPPEEVDVRSHVGQLLNLTIS